MHKNDNKLQFQMSQLREHYDKLARNHGYGPEAVQQSSLETQEQRLRLLAESVRDPFATVLDFGCGTGHLYEVLKREQSFAGLYTGYDLSDELLDLARSTHPDAAFEQRDVFVDGVGGIFDYVLISGVFNNQIGINWDFMTRVLETLFPFVKKCLAFNALSAYVDFKDSSLYYADPEQVFRFCKEKLSPAVNLRHDYEVKTGVLPFEFTIQVTPSAHLPRKKKLD